MTRYKDGNFQVDEANEGMVVFWINIIKLRVSYEDTLNITTISAQPPGNPDN